MLDFTLGILNCVKTYKTVSFPTLLGKETRRLWQRHSGVVIFPQRWRWVGSSSRFPCALAPWVFPWFIANEMRLLLLPPWPHIPRFSPCQFGEGCRGEGRSERDNGPRISYPLSSKTGVSPHLIPSHSSYLVGCQLEASTCQLPLLLFLLIILIPPYLHSV